MKFPIVFSTDHNFVMPTCVTIHSLLKNAKEDISYDINIIIDSDVSEEDKALVAEQVEKDDQNSSINFINIGNTFQNGFEIRDISKACYNRLMIPWLLPQYDKIVYSDVDIIFTSDISDVYKIDMQNYLIAGVGGEVWGKGFIKKYLKKLSLKPEEYINSGFLLINSQAQREADLKDKYLELSKRKFIYQDQDILNLVCKNRIKRLSAKYNANPKYAHKTDDIRVIHYFGFKPWNHFTFSWLKWWEVYNSSILYDPEFNCQISSRILENYEELKKRIKIMHQKLKFLYRYLSI